MLKAQFWAQMASIHHAICTSLSMVVTLWCMGLCSMKQSPIKHSHMELQLTKKLDWKKLSRSTSFIFLGWALWYVYLQDNGHVQVGQEGNIIQEGLPVLHCRRPDPVQIMLLITDSQQCCCLRQVMPAMHVLSISQLFNLPYFLWD